MQQIRRGWRAWCMMLGVALFLFGSSTVAMAQSGTPTYADWFKIIVGLLIAVIGAYAKGVESRVTKVEAQVDTSKTRITDLRELLGREYHDKDEIDKRFDRIERMLSEDRKTFSDGLASIHRRLDFLRVPPAARPLHEDNGA